MNKNALSTTSRSTGWAGRPAKPNACRCYRFAGADDRGISGPGAKRLGVERTSRNAKYGRF